MSPLSKLSYYPYALISCGIDAEWSRARRSAPERNPFCESKEAFERIVTSYRSSLESVQETFLNHQQKEFSGPEGLCDYLYNPKAFFALDHSDLVAMTLVDDLDAVSRIMSRASTTVEQTTLGFIPDLTLLFPSKKPPSWFCECSDLFSPSPFPLPLGVTVQFKLSGLASLGRGLLMQEKVYTKMIAKITETIERLSVEISVRKSLHLQGKPPLACTFIDFQGPEEIGLLMRCDNFSVALSIVTALRTLTFNDVLPSPTDWDFLNSSCLHAELLEQAAFSLEEATAGSSGSLPDLVGHKHIFQSSNSTLYTSFSEETMEGSGKWLNKEGINGQISARIEMIACPGHGASILDRLKTENNCLGNKHIDDKIRWITPGVHDFSIAPQSSGPNEACQTISLVEFLDAFEEFFLMFMSSGPNKGNRSIKDAICALTIPVLKVSEQYATPKSPFSFEELLREVRDFACSSNSGPLSLKKLTQKGLLKSCLPVSLRRSIEYLFHDFSVLLGDPCLFDVVLDLYDPFAAFHRVLTADLPNNVLSSGPWVLGGKENGDEVCLPQDLARPVAAHDQVMDIAEYAMALHNALSHRASHAQYEYPIRDMAVDFRGGMNQIILACEAVQKCATGIYRHRVGKAHNYESVGCVTQVALAPSAQAKIIRCGKKAVGQLALFRVDVAHVLHVASYADYLHEAFHLLYAVRQKHISPFLEDCPPELARDLRECFSLLGSLVFLYECEKKSFLFNTVLTYSRDTQSVQGTDEETIHRFSRFLIILFIVVDSVRNFESPYPWEWDLGDSVLLGIRTSRRNAWKRFEKMCHLCGRFFSEYERLWQGPEKRSVWKYTKHMFMKVYPRAVAFMPSLVKEIAETFCEVFAKTNTGLPKECWRNATEELDDLVSKSLKENRPLTWARVSSYMQNLGNEIAPEDAQFGIFFPVRRLLYKYIGSIRNIEEGDRIHLLRSCQTGRVTFEDAKWYDFLSDKGMASLFCPIHSKRAIRLGKQITLMKSFGDVSSELRARRLLRLIQQASQKPGEDACCKSSKAEIPDS